MAAPSFVQASTGGTDAMGAWSATGTAGTSGNVVILQILQDGSTAGAVTLDSATNIEDLAGTDNQWTFIGTFPGGSGTTHYQHIWIGRLINASAPTATGSNSTSEDVYWRFYEFNNVNTGTTLADVIEQNGTTTPSTSSGTSGTISDAGVTTTGPDRLALNFVGIDDDNALADFIGETGGDWVEAVAEYAESSGTDATIGLQISPVFELGYPANWTQYSLGNTTSRQKIAQSFSAPSTGSSWIISSWLSTSGSPTDDVVVEIQSDSSGSPSGTVLGSATIDPTTSEVPPRTRYDATISASLTSSSTYWIVWSRTGSLSDTNLYFIATTFINHPTRKDYDGAAWNTNSDEIAVGITSSTWSGATIDGGTTTNSDATDGWGVVGFALIGTTVTETVYVPRYAFTNFQEPGVF